VIGVFISKISSKLFRHWLIDGEQTSKCNRS